MDEVDDLLLVDVVGLDEHAHRRGEAGLLGEAVDVGDDLAALVDPLDRVGFDPRPRLGGDPADESYNFV